MTSHIISHFIPHFNPPVIIAAMQMSGDCKAKADVRDM